MKLFIIVLAIILVGFACFYLGDKYQESQCQAQFGKQWHSHYFSRSFVCVNSNGEMKLPY